MSHSRPDSENTTQNESLKAWWSTPFCAAFGGATGALVAYPFEGLKKSQQGGLTITYKPREIYRGTLPFAGSLIPTTILQMSMKHFFDQLQLPEEYQQHQAKVDTATGLVSAATGAFASTAAEKIILTQRSMKIGPLEAIKYVANTQGYLGLWNGLSLLAVRETVFGSCMMMYGKKAYDNYGVLGSLGLGFAGAVISHPFDTLATKMQKASLENSATGESKAITVADTFKKTVAKHGTKGLFSGLGWRLGLFTSCMVAIPYAQKQIENGLENIQRKTR